ncbi:MAG: rRNA pseudouridine synthase [Fidelibacterota bacterium]|nr:MAG: rRNA pseudouridine synthase [Candidatus Neomarinimicrobiota bacterium]
MRLNKYLARSGVAARRKADELIAAGRVRVNDRQVTTLGVDIGEDDLVEVDGRPVEPQPEQVVYLLHKPAGVISSVTDPQGRETVVELIRNHQRLFPIGRLDRDTTGALLITNDGELANLLTHPRYGVEKRYRAEVKGRLNPRAIDRLSAGTVLPGGLKVRAQIKEIARHGRRTSYQLVLTEGKNREIKRIFKHYGLPLVKLHRTSFAGLSADSLPPGRSRRLRRAEMNNLYHLTAPQYGSQTT